MEMNRAENQIDNNIIWDIRNAEPGTLGQRGAAVPEFFCTLPKSRSSPRILLDRCDNVGVFPVLREDRNGSGNGREHKIYNNIFARCDKGGIVFLHEQNEAEGNVLCRMPERFADSSFLIQLSGSIWRSGALTRGIHWQDCEPRNRVRSGASGVEDQRARWVATRTVFNHLDIDMFGQTTGPLRQPGPFAEFDTQRSGRPIHDMPFSALDRITQNRISRAVEHKGGSSR
jgi:hypothetical protein